MDIQAGPYRIAREREQKATDCQDSIEGHVTVNGWN